MLPKEGVGERERERERGGGGSSKEPLEVKQYNRRQTDRQTHRKSETESERALKKPWRSNSMTA